MKILANLSFLPNEKKEYKSGLIVDFSIRKDMFNSGKIVFVNTDIVHSNEENIKAYIIFAHENLVLPFLDVGVNFIFGEIGHPYGKGVVLELLEEEPTIK